MDLELIVTGTPRSGTVYMAKVLTELGFPCGHETIFQENGINKPEKLSALSLETTGSWVDPTKIIADSSYMAVPYLDLQMCKKIHVLRNPLKVVRSLTYGINYFKNSNPSNRWEEFIYNHEPKLKEDMTPIERACLFYVLWNKRIKADFTYKIESSLKLLTDYLNVPYKEVNISNKTNTFTYEKGTKTILTIESIPDGYVKDTFVDYCKEIGYDLKCLLF